MFYLIFLSQLLTHSYIFVMKQHKTGWLLKQMELPWKKKTKRPTCSKSHARIQFAANNNQFKVYTCCPETQQKEGIKKNDD